MDRLGRGEKFLVLITFFLLLLITLLPQIIHWNKGFSGGNVLYHDEFNYNGKIERVLQGADYLCSTWVKDPEPSLCLITNLPSYLLSIPGKVLGIRAIDFFYWYRPIFSLLSLALIFLFLKSFSLPLMPGFLIASSFFFLPGTWHFKPFFSLLSTYNDFNFFRFVNPLVPLTFFFLCFYLGAKSFLQESRQMEYSVGAGLSLALLFYISPFYVVHVCLFYFLCILHFRNKENLGAFFFIVLTSLTFTLPFWFDYFELIRDPWYKVTTWRNGISIKDNGLELLSNLSLYPYILLSFFFLQKKFPSHYRYIALGCLSGVLCYFQTLITRIEIQNFHFKYSLIPMACLVLVLLYEYLREKLASRLTLLDKRVLLGSLILLIMTPLSLRKMTSFIEKVSELNSSKEFHSYKQAFEFLRSQKKDHVTLATDHIMLAYPLYGGGYVLREIATMLAPSQEIMERNLIAGKLYFNNDVQAYLNEINPTGKGIMVWPEGMPEETRKRMERRGYPAIKGAIYQEIANDFAHEFGKVDRARLKELLLKYPVDFLLIGPLERKEGIAGLSLFDPILVKDFGEVQIYRPGHNSP